MSLEKCPIQCFNKKSEADKAACFGRDYKKCHYYQRTVSEKQKRVFRRRY